MKKLSSWVVIGCGILFGLTVMCFSFWAIYMAATVIFTSAPPSHKQLIEECEKSLPRDKTCKLVAVEESE